MLARVILSFAALAGNTLAQPTVQPWPVEGPDDTVAVAGAALAGWYAAADSFEDSVEIRDIRQALVRTITREEIGSLAPWMLLGAGPDGPDALAWTDSGRWLFIGVHDDTVPDDGLPNDVILRYDLDLDQLTMFARTTLFNRDDQWPHLAAAHFKGRLYVARNSGGVTTFKAERNDATGSNLGSSQLPGNAPVRGLAVDRNNGFLFACSDTAVYRANLAAFPLTWTWVGDLSNLRALAFSDHFGGTGQDGLYVLSGTTAPESYAVHFVATRQALGLDAFAPVPYTTGDDDWHDLAALADGRLLAGADEDAALISDASDTRLGFDGWMADEFAQVVDFGKGLISPDGEPWGWVIDGDVDVGLDRFHPATPDGAAWVVALLIASHELTGDPGAQGLVRDILIRYAGLAPDGIKPSITADGFMRHWIDPFTGNTKADWSPEFATMSTMKIVMAAERARAHFAFDPDIRAAASTLICQVETVGTGLLERKDELLEELEKIREDNEYLFAALMVTDIIEGGTELLVAGASSLLEHAFDTKIKDGVIDLPGVMSRKKQVAPKLLSAL